MRRGIVDDGYGRIASSVVAQQEAPSPGGMDLSKQITEFRQDVSNAGLYYYPPAAESALLNDVGLDLPDADQWIMLEGTMKQGTGYIDESNMNAILESLESGADSGDVLPADGGEFAVRVFNPDGSLTAAGKIMQDVIAALSDYPVLDDQDVSQREYDATLENFESEGYGVVSEDAPADWPKQVFGWLWDNAQDEVWGHDPDEDGGYWASAELIQQAARELGFAQEDDEDEEENEDEFPEEPDPLLENFATGPVPADPRQMSLPFKGGRRRAQEEVAPEEGAEDPSTPPNWEAWRKVIQQETVKTPTQPGSGTIRDPRFLGRRKAQAAPKLPEEEQELGSEDLEEVAPTPEQQGLEKFDWDSYMRDMTWGQFRKKPALRLRAQMSIQDDAIVRMVTQEDARLVRYRGGLALVPVDGYAYPVDDAGAELALAHGAGDWTNPQARMKAGGREVLVEIYKGVSDTGLERIAQKTSGTRRQAYEPYYKGEHGTGETGNEILDAMARAIFVDSWATEWEYLFEEYDKDFLKEAAAELDIEVPSFMQAELMEIAPPTEPEAYQVAQKMYDAIEQENGINLETFLPQGYGEDDYLDRRDFGHYLAMESMGHGVSWSDSHEDHGLKIPSVEGYVVVDEVERLKSFIEENYEFDSEEVPS